MPKTVKDMIGAVEKDGWELKRQKGSHRQFKHPTKKGNVTIAGHPSDDLDPGTEKSIRSQAGIQ